MSSTTARRVDEPLTDLSSYMTGLERWLAEHPEDLRDVNEPLPSFADRVAAMSRLLEALYAAGWSRYGWPEGVGGRGGSILHRAALWDALARHGVPGMTLFEHIEVLGPTLVALGPRPFVGQALPAFLAGQERWAQAFSEPGAGSDLASVRTRAVPVEDGYVITGRKIWTSWARYARWALLLARTGTPESRHRGLTAFVLDLHAPGVEVTPIEQANGTDELAEVALDAVRVPGDRIVGEIDGGWQVAMHILSHERGTYPWFRHCFLYGQLRDGLGRARPEHDHVLGNALLDLAATSATSRAALRAHATGSLLGPRAAFTKLLLCAAEQATSDWVLANDADLAIGVQDDDVAVDRQEYLFSRIVTVYGGSQQMQLNTIAKQVLALP
jgi:alkylation response protein AidB-like acyl-CoA dehydrogenase